MVFNQLVSNIFYLLFYIIKRVVGKRRGGLREEGGWGKDEVGRVEGGGGGGGTPSLLGMF